MPVRPPADIRPCGPVVIDLPGRRLDAADRRRLAHPLVGGVVLFDRNIESREQVAGLVAAMRRIRPGLLVCIDQEGGRVQRLVEGFTRIPPMAGLGRAWERDPIAASRQATAIGRTIGSELRAVGIDLSFAPVLDLDHGRCEVIGDRALHRDPRVVTLLARAIVHGMLLAGMGNCGKHFPGHGHVGGDSHHELPVDRRSLRRLLAEDAAPYGWMGETLLAVMPAHVAYPRIDALPAGFSRIWLQDILRGQLGFDGLVFSDDLTMAGAAVMGDIVERAHAAIAAGCDMILVCHDRAQADRVLANLKWRPDPAFGRRLAALRPR
ncbi:MAG: beta-N-acetylhexosaminidase [Burkholderiaceae bacterium]|nr:beta-N-acetylhexosaminidase [Burkholderiaceae bacterium]MEB2318755.1 beta-N-acetylhexosaminidase [Pseudomonadota bacterium]